jgi:hypothetical protein
MKGEGNMNNIKNTISRVMIIALTACSLMSGISANAVTKGAIVPQPTVKGLKATYKYNSTIKFNIAAPNYTRKVKYKVSLYSFSTKKSLDLTKGFSKSMSGSKTLVLNVTSRASGKYSLRIYVKALASKSTYDKYLEKSFTIEANKSIIASALLNASTLEKSVAAGINIGNVPSSDKTKFQSVINDSLVVMNNVYASQQLVDAKLQALKVAVMDFKSAKKQPVDNTALITVIKVAQQKINNSATGAYPLESQLVLRNYKNTLSVAITDAIKVAVNRNATIQTVSEAVINLNNATTVFANQVQDIGINS